MRPDHITLMHLNAGRWPLSPLPLSTAPLSVFFFLSSSPPFSLFPSFLRLQGGAAHGPVQQGALINPALMAN